MVEKPKKSKAPRAPKVKDAPAAPEAKAYEHPTAESPARPEAGAQARFRQKKQPKEYAYDSSLAPDLVWDGANAAGRDRAERLIATIRNATDLDGAKTAAAELAAMSKPFLNWAGKKERLSFDVPTLPLFVHERLSTKAILDSVQDKRVNQQTDFLTALGGVRRSIADQVLKSYQYAEPWTNRMVLGDSLVVMNSLLEYEGLGGKVQMIYIDPPYGVKYNSNFQPFVGKRDVKHGDDADLTREPEMVQAYRDTWELGLHSYLSYLRDRLQLARELLTTSGSVFVQISDDNFHHVKELMDEVFGSENAVGVITFRKTAGQTARFLASTADFLVWYGRDVTHLKYRPYFVRRSHTDDDAYAFVELPGGERRRIAAGERANPESIPVGGRPFRHVVLHSQRQGRPSGPGSAMHFPIEFEGKSYTPPGNRGWTTTLEGIQRLMTAGRLAVQGNSLSYIRFFDDFPAIALSSVWDDTQSGSAMDKLYVVQTNQEVIKRCMAMTTDPGDLVVDPTCGSGTTAYVAEEWGRRWITIDTSRVPLALARQRLLTATFDWYELKDDSRGPAGGFSYRRKQNARGEEIGGIIPHVTLKSIANDETAEEEVLVDRPEITKGVVRVTGSFTVEATIPTPVDFDADGVEDSGAVPDHADWIERVTNILRRSPKLHLGASKTIELTGLRPPAKTLSLSAEAGVDGRPIAIVIGPEHGSVSEKLVSEAGREAYQKGYQQLLVIGLAIEPNARALVEQSESVMGVPSVYVQATPDLLMGDLLKTMRSSQIFSVCGLPDVRVTLVERTKKEDPTRWQVTLTGLDLFDPVTMNVEGHPGEDVPCWMLDQDYDGLVFRASQVFFPRTKAWDALQRALRADFDASVWEHLGGTTSTPFSAPEGKRAFTIAVKVIDPRGNELLVTREVSV
jgi:adenine-specific DNA-methyltransferase